MTPLLPPLPRPPRPLPFRLGLTSYVYPDAILPNVRALADTADDIELLFLESGDHSNLPDPAEIRALADIAAEHALSYTIHFPIDKALGSPSAQDRQVCLDQTLRIIDLCRPLNPHGWILHLEGIEPDDSPARIAAWQRDLVPLVERIVAAVKDPGRLCVENLGYPYDWCRPILELAPFSHCLDIGHLWQMQYDWQAHVRTWLPTTRIVHLYGADQTSRHHALPLTPAPLAAAFLKSLGNYRDVLTLETFGYDDTRASLERLIELTADIPSRHSQPSW